ncbi:MAG: D-sedoheptulose 7-phosphate isomerase [Actinomycetota bacterium]|nr:D-sedoheptulose 7-phosphate isomerase [Actinomycetota bacterium]
MPVSPVGFVADQYAIREAVVQGFFHTHAPEIAELCHSMARRFIRGGRLLAFGAGAAATDAQHVSVEFVHPVIVGKRALPALALPNDVPSVLGFASTDPVSSFARQLQVIGHEGDIALGMVHGPRDPGGRAAAAGLEEATARGMLTISLAGAGEGSPAEHVFTVDCDDTFVVQEVHETLYHVLWELVHVFFEHKGLLEDRPRGSSHDTGRSSFLYPFLAEAETGVEAVLEEVASSVLRKASDVTGMRNASERGDELADTAHRISERLRAGGKLLTFGNGGSATDAQDLVADCLAPPDGLAPVPAISLTNDSAVITAVANDVGVENIFARQVIAYGQEQDVAVAISTSGGSRNVLLAVEEARRRGLLTVCFAGYGGGRLAEACDCSHTIDADYIPRIQEAQATQYHVLRRLLAFDELSEPATTAAGRSNGSESST